MLKLSDTECIGVHNALIVNDKVLSSQHVVVYPYKSSYEQLNGYGSIWPFEIHEAVKKT